MSSVHRKLDRVRKPRVHITYEVETNGAMIKTELPFIVGVIGEGMILAIEPGCYWEEGGGLRVEDNFLITNEGAEKLSGFPDGIVPT